MSTARKPLNRDAADLRAVADYTPIPLRTVIDYYRSRALAQSLRLEQSMKFDAAGWYPPNCPVGRPEIEGPRMRMINSVLHHLLRLNDLEPCE